VLYYNTTGSNNVAIGFQALENGLTGSNNTAVGYSSLSSNDASNNTAIGYSAGTNDVTGSNNTYLGSNTSNQGNFKYSTAIGYNAEITANNQIMMGTANETVFIPGTLICTSFIGTTGATGPTGANGINGTNGNTGPTGANGINGTNGATGPTGANGINGTNGNTGPTGANGINGTNGNTGPTGANGINGTNGNTGPTGANGINGTNGNTGPTGPYGDALWIYSGTFNTVTPTGSTGTTPMVDCPGGITGTTASFTYVTAINYSSTSDYRIKSNIKTLDDTYVVDTLNPVAYLNNQTEKQDMGLIAHELQEVYPFLVNGKKDDDTYQTVNYMGLIALLIKETKELKQRVKLLEETR